ncbi:hypothetical protein JRO89_XS08G0075500 [Xanthoceras sorbifolium]|nr:hypothetical protein JRO89_XS08G0075500 [Xanthoceras sorbifolium]
MVRLLGLVRGESDESPREITSRTLLASDSSENGWLIRFFDSSFFCEWIAVSYLYKHDHPGVRDYLCNRMYTLPLLGIEGYLFQICYMSIHKPSPSLDKFVIDMCSKSLKIALKVHWFLMAEVEDTDDNEGISRIQEKCQIAATLMGEWPPLVRSNNAGSSPGSKNQVLNKILSSKQRLLSLTSSPPTQRSLSFSPSSGNSLQEDASQLTPEENKIFKKFIPGPKVRDALLFRKSVDKEEEESEKDGFFKRLLRDSRGEDEELMSSSEGFFKRLLRDSKTEDEELTSSSEGFFKRLFRDSKSDSDDKSVAKSLEDDEKEGFFKKFFKEKFDDKKDGKDRNEDGEMVNSEEKSLKSPEDDEKEGFFRKFFKEKFEDKKDGNDRIDEGNTNAEDEEPSDFSLFRRLFRVHPEDAKNTSANEHSNNGGLFESSPGTENFFRKLFRDRDRSVEDSELFGSKKHNEQKRPGSPKQNEKSNAKPPLPINTASQFRKGAYHESLDFVHVLCETSYGLVDIFPVEDRKIALRESLAEINLRIAEVQNSGGICFPMGKGMYRVVHIPEDEAVLLNSREKAPYLICVEVLKSEQPSTTKDASGAQKLSRGGIPLANSDAFLPKPPPWAYPLWTAQEAYRNSTDRMSMSTAQAIDQAMTHKPDTKLKFVNVSLSVEKQMRSQSKDPEVSDSQSDIICSSMRPAAVPDTSNGSQDGVIHASRAAVCSDLEWVRVVLTADPGVRMEDIEDQGQPRRKEHRRVPSTVAIEEVKAAAAKGEAPPGLPLKGAGQDSSDAQPRANGGTPKASDALSGELWEVKKERIQKASVYGKLPGWDLRSPSLPFVPRLHCVVFLAFTSPPYAMTEESSTTSGGATGLPNEESIFGGGNGHVLRVLSFDNFNSKSPSSSKSPISLHEPESFELNESNKGQFESNFNADLNESFVLNENNLELDRSSIVTKSQQNVQDKTDQLSNSIDPSSNSPETEKNPIEIELETRKSDCPDSTSTYCPKMTSPNRTKPTRPECTENPTSPIVYSRKKGLKPKQVQSDLKTDEELPIAQRKGTRECTNRPLYPVIVKSGDDCRQEHLAVQLISHFYDIFQEAGLPLWLRPYEVLVTSSYTALIETIPDTASLHSIKSRYPNVSSLRDFFVAKYEENSPSFKLAQRNFVESMAGYSLVCYLLQVKDRHNGNLLMDEEGHIIHIDFGFMLSNSPGGVNFESAPFKLTRELLEVMDSDAEGVPSEFFDYFKVLCIQGFLTCRKHAERIILLVEMLQDSGFPCFKGGPRTIQNLRKRFHLSLTEEQCVSLVLSLISSSLDAWRTRQYDYYQRVLNGIL